MKEYSRGKYILLCGQVPWDASVEGSNHIEWLEETIERLKQKTEMGIVFRPHPLSDLPPFRGAGYSRIRLEEDIAGAHAVVTFNSNTGVDAALAGKPVFAADEGSMVWNLCNRDLKDIKEPKYWPMNDRAQWAFNLAYAQWTPLEMREGLAWKHLFR